MPVATITETSRKEELKTVPDGYVVVKRMTWGQKMTRQSMAMKMFMRTSPGKKQDMETEIEMRQRATSLWSFANLIESHNLTELMADGTERPLNFKNVADVEKLDGKVGEEIDSLIDKMNNFEDDKDSTEEGTLGN